MPKKSLIGIIGSVILFVGVFAPIISVPILGNLNYFQNGKGDGVVIIILALLSLMFSYNKFHKGLFFTGFGSLAVIAFTFINIQMRISEMKSKLNADLAGNPFRGIADMAVHSVQIQWGFAVLLIGAALLIVAYGMKEPEMVQKADLNNEDTTSCPYCAEKIKKEAKICRFCNRELDSHSEESEEEKNVNAGQN